MAILKATITVASMNVRGSGLVVRVRLRLGLSTGVLCAEALLVETTTRPVVRLSRTKLRTRCMVLLWTTS